MIFMKQYTIGGDRLRKCKRTLQKYNENRRRRMNMQFRRMGAESDEERTMPPEDV